MAGADIITIHQGEDVTFNFTMSPVVDITGWTIEMNVRKSPGVLVTVTGAVVNGPNGTFSVAFTDAETDGLTPSSYAYDVWRTDAGGERALALGHFRVLEVVRDVTV